MEREFTCRVEGGGEGGQVQGGRSLRRRSRVGWVEVEREVT